MTSVQRLDGTGQRPWSSRIIASREVTAPIPRLRRTFNVAKAQLLPFIAGMPKRDGGSAFPPEVMDLLLLSPPDRPAGGGRAKP